MKLRNVSDHLQHDEWPLVTMTHITVPIMNDAPHPSTQVQNDATDHVLPPPPLSTTHILPAPDWSPPRTPVLFIDYTSDSVVKLHHASAMLYCHVEILPCLPTCSST